MNPETDHIDLTELLKRLLGDLDYIFNGEPGETLSPQTEQQRYGAAAGAVARFLFKIHPDHAGRFVELMNALVDQSQGLRPLLLKGLKRKSAPNPTQIEVAKANVAFALDALIELGEKPENAAARLVREFPAIKNLAGAKSHRANSSWAETLLEWRKTLSAVSRAERRNSVAQEWFQVGRKLIEFLMKNGRQDELKNEALGRAKKAAQVGVFVGHSNTL